MEEAVTCSVCFRVYQQGTRDPLVLPCGHTFCRMCVAFVHNSSGGALVCPTCRRDSGAVDPSKLPVCYPLVGLSSTYSDIKFGSCVIHKEEQRFWCYECEVPLCSLCLYSEHEQGHTMLPAQTVMEDKKQRITKRLSGLRDEVIQRRGELYNLYDCLTAKMKEILSLEEKIDLLSDDMEDACCVEDFLACEGKIKALDEDNGPSQVRKLDGTEEKMEDMKLAKLTFEGSEPDSADECRTSSQQLKENHDIQRMRLDYKEGRLLLHSTAHPAEGHVSIKISSEVFLELGVGGVCLGRVYISLWSHLRRAQQFLALCMGTMGVSYVGSCFSHVAYLNAPKETLCCTEYWGHGNGPGTKELLVDLEWGGKYSEEPRPGLLIPLSKFVDQHGFGICTRGNPGGTFHCPFGEVISGMEVIRAAVEHQPVTEVIITHCGIVFPDLSP